MECNEPGYSRFYRGNHLVNVVVSWGSGGVCGLWGRLAGGLAYPTEYE